MDAWALRQAGNLRTGFLALSQIRAPGSARSYARARGCRTLTPVTPQCYYQLPRHLPPKSIQNGLGSTGPWSEGQADLGVCYFPAV